MVEYELRASLREDDVEIKLLVYTVSAKKVPEIGKIVRLERESPSQLRFRKLEEGEFSGSEENIEKYRILARQGELILGCKEKHGIRTKVWAVPILYQF
jgi:hypothetical protein